MMTDMNLSTISNLKKEKSIKPLSSKKSQNHIYGAFEMEFSNYKKY